MWPFNKKTEEISRTTPGYEESERKTPIVGKLLLLIMFVAGTFFGWRALDDLGRIPKEPAPLSACAYRYEGSVYLEDTPLRSFRLQPLYYDNAERCQFSQLEKDYNIPPLFEPRIPLEKELKPLNENLNSVNASLNEVRYQIDRVTNEYGVGLQERQAQVEKPLFPTGPSGQSVVSLRQRESELLPQKSDLENKINAISGKIKEIDKRLKEAYRPVFEEQNRKLRWYEFEIFILQLVVIFPFFLLVFWGYLRQHRKNSPYTVIFTAMVTVASVLFLRIVLFWFWGLFLARVLEVIIRWFGHYGFFRTILFYTGMILSFVIFGGAVWWLQRKVFDPRRVLMRRFRNKQCPHCQTSLDLSVFYCPNCGIQLKSKCGKCGQARFVGLPSCPHCGDKI